MQDKFLNPMTIAITVTLVYALKIEHTDSRPDIKQLCKNSESQFEFKTSKKLSLFSGLTTLHSFTAASPPVKK